MDTHSVCCCSKTFAENIRKAAPKAEEWWRPTKSASLDSQDAADEYSDDGEDDRYETVVIKSLSQEKSFHNCGLETWHKARKEWNKRTVETLPPRPTPAEYNQLVKGLKKHSNQRTYELPRRMVLSDLIGVYNDIWEGGDGF